MRKGLGGMCDEKRAWAVCEAVRAARKRKGYTQEKLGKLMNRHPSYVAKVEQGKLTMSLDGLFDLMDALDVDANTIIGARVTTSSAVVLLTVGFVRNQSEIFVR